MMQYNDLNNYYFEWLFDTVCKDRYSDKISYRKLLMYLHGKEFRWSIPKDRNRASDGIDLRYRFNREYNDILDECSNKDAAVFLTNPCSVFEMMVALSIRCEETIKDNPLVGDRTGQWFWSMISNLGLGSMHDDIFNKRFVETVIDRFLDREYAPNGKGGLFTILNCDRDLRDIEIWIQLCWYLNTIA